MSYARTLHNCINSNLVEAVLARAVRKPAPKAIKFKRTPRSGSYRAARRNEARRTKTLDVMKRFAPEPKYLGAPAAYLNRSENWPRAMTYAYAREIRDDGRPVR
ncbi:hypothetical protein ACRAVF_27065 [Bradyrhizobium oligotrophicum S58]